MLTMDDATEENMAELVRISDLLLTETVARVNLTTGRYQFDRKENARINDEELKRFAKSLVDERKVRLSNQEESGEEEEEEAEADNDDVQEYLENFLGDRVAMKGYRACGCTIV